MNMFARFDENPAMTLQDIKETKRYGGTDTSTHGQRENSMPTTNKVCGGYKERYKKHSLLPTLFSILFQINCWFIGIYQGHALQHMCPNPCARIKELNLKYGKLLSSYHTR